MSEDKGYPLPDPVTGYPLICVTLKIPDVLQYRQDFIGHIWELGKWWNWEQSGTPGDTRAAQAAEYWRELLATYLVIGDCPVDCCDDILAAIAALQTQANDQAALNLTNQVTQQQIESQRLRDVLEDRYDGTPTSINPDAPTTNFGATGDRYEALCAGLTAFVYQFARSQADSVRAGQVGGLIAIALVAALLIPGLNFFFLVGASLAVVLGLGTIGVSTETAIAALTDQDALGNVICCMRDNLKDLEVTEANWLTALGGCAFDVGSHEQIVADFLGAKLADNYLTILNILGQAYTGVVDGVALPECPCEPPPPSDCQDFTADEGLWAVKDAIGTYISGQGYQGLFFSGFGSTALWVEKEALDGAPDIDEISFTFGGDIDISSAFLYINDVFSGGLSGISDENDIIFSEATIGGSWPKPGGSRYRLQMDTPGGNDWRLIQACMIPE